MAKKTITKRKVEVEMRPYELMLILNPELRESEVKKKLKEITDMIEKAGGKITHEDFWGKKALAYRIRQNSEGVYMVYNLELPSNSLSELKEHLRIEKEVLRSMILKLPADYAYTKYDLESAMEEQKKERKSAKKNVSIKHNAPVIPAKPKKEEEEKVEKAEVEKEVAEKSVEQPEDEEVKESDEATDEAKEAEESSEKDEKESELDRKLDEILGGEDLNL